MKYIRTKDNVFEVTGRFAMGYYNQYIRPVFDEDIIKQANTIEELCDKFVKTRPDLPTLISQTGILWNVKRTGEEIYGAIWTDKGLIYVAKMNDEGEFELL